MNKSQYQKDYEWVVIDIHANTLKCALNRAEERMKNEEYVGDVLCDYLYIDDLKIYYNSIIDEKEFPENWLEFIFEKIKK